MLEYINKNSQIISIIIRSHYHNDGIKFFTPNDFSQQLAFMTREKGYVIPPHIHNIVERRVFLTQEVLYIKSGKIRVDYYDEDKVYLESRMLNQGDVVLFSSGGHGFTMIEKSEIVEVKQGPYSGDHDKTRFNPITEEEINLK